MTRYLRAAVCVVVAGGVAVSTGCSSEKPSEPKTSAAPDPKLQRAERGTAGDTPAKGKPGGVTAAGAVGAN